MCIMQMQCLFSTTTPTKPNHKHSSSNRSNRHHYSSSPTAVKGSRDITYLTMKLLLQLFFHVTVVTSIGADGNHASSSSQAPKLPHRSDLKVKRTLLESVYPEFSTFKGDMHAGLLPAVLIDDETSNSEDFSSYMFWLFQPDPDTTVEVSVEMLSNCICFSVSSIAQLHIILYA